MQRPTDNLRADHVLTSRAIRVLAAIAEQLESGGPFPSADCATLLRFQREFVLAVHMRKEDEFLCPAVAMRASDDAVANVGELLRLREEIAELSHSLWLFWEPADELTEPERAGFAATVETLAGLLRRRQELEESVLFPACETAVPPDDQLDWVEQFAALERERGAREQWAAQIDALAAKWLA